MLLIAVIAVAVSVTAPLITAAIISKGVRAQWASHLEAFQALLTVSAIILTAAWYFIERPDEPKIEFSQELSSFRVSKDDVLVLISVKIKNVGSTSAEFNNSPYQAFVQKVIPISTNVENELHIDRRQKFASKIGGANNWGVISTLESHPDAPAKYQPSALLSFFLEAGEEENYYYRVKVACQKNLVIAVSSRFIRRNKVVYLWEKRRDLAWIKQSYLDLSDQCRRSGK